MSTGKTQLGLEPNVNAVLCYMPVCCLGLVVSIVTVVVEKQNRFAKFHAFQSLLVWGASIVLTVALQIAMVSDEHVVGPARHPGVGAHDAGRRWPCSPSPCCS